MNIQIDMNMKIYKLVHATTNTDIKFYYNNGKKRKGRLRLKKKKSETKHLSTG